MVNYNIFLNCLQKLVQNRKQLILIILLTEIIVIMFTMNDLDFSRNSIFMKEKGEHRRTTLLKEVA